MSNSFRKILVAVGVLSLLSLFPFLTANPQQVTANQPFTYPLLGTSAACASSASPASCSADPAGFVVIAVSSSTVVVDTSAVTAKSQIFVVFDASLAGALGITQCNSTSGAANTYFVSARSPGTSFTIGSSNPIMNHPACLSYFIVN
jgi:hypothetical protein